MAYSDVYAEGSFPKKLSEEETIKYFQLARNGDQDAKDKLKMHNLRLVTYVINNKFLNLIDNNAIWDMDDLISIGTYGLIKAVDTFNIEKKVKFSTYAISCITNEILMSVRKNKNEITNTSLSDSINQDKDGNDLTTSDILATDENIVEDYEERELHQEVREALVVLNEREKQIITMRYGFNGEPMTQIKIAEILGISRSYVSRIDNIARKKISQYLEQRGYIVNKRLTEEQMIIKQMNGIEKSTYLAKIMINNNLTIEQLSSKYNLSVVSIKNMFAKYLKSSDEQLFKQVLALIDEQINKLKEYKIQEKLRKQKVREAYQSNSSYNSKSKNAQVVTKGTVKMQSLLLSIFPNYTKEEISEAIKELPKEEREILLLRYPLEEGVQHSLLDLASQYNIKTGSINWKIKSIINHTTKILERKKNPISQAVPQENNKSYSVTKSNSIFDLFPEHTEQQVLEAINSLSEINRKYLELKYGLNGMPVTRHKDIAFQLDIKITNMGGRFKSIKDQLYRKLNNNETVRANTNKNVRKTAKQAMSMNIFTSYPAYSEEEVLAAINLLNEKNKLAIELRYGLNGHLATSVKDIAVLLDEQEKNITARLGNSKKRIADLLSGKSKRLTSDNTSNTKSNSNLIKNDKRIKNISIFDFYPNYSEQEVLDAIDTLSDINKRIIELKYGLNGNEIHRTKEISELLDIEYKTLSVRIPNIRTSLDKRLQQKESFGESTHKKRIYTKKSEKGIYALFPNFTKEEIDEVFNELESKRKKLLELRYGLNGTEEYGVRAIAQALDCKQKEVTKRLDYIIKLMLKRLNDRKINTNYQETDFEIPQLKLPTSKIEIEQFSEVPDEGIELLTKTTLDFEQYRYQIKKLIGMLDDPNEQVILLLRLGYVRNQNFTETQICEFLNIEETEVHETIQRGLSNIIGISAITMNSVEAAKIQLNMTKMK